MMYTNIKSVTLCNDSSRIRLSVKSINITRSVSVVSIKVDTDEQPISNVEQMQIAATFNGAYYFNRNTGTVIIDVDAKYIAAFS